MYVNKKNLQNGFTLMELMVGLAIFGVVGLSLVAFSSMALRTMGIESRSAIATEELRNALTLMSTELRMSSSLSPYIVGTTASAVNCSSAFALTATTLKFLVVQDEAAAATAGIQPYYVGYRYDPATRRLLRGEIAGATILSCVPPTGDPTNITTAQVLAENVWPIDSDGNGVLESVFVANGNSVGVNLGIQINGGGGRSISQAMPISIFRRSV